MGENSQGNNTAEAMVGGNKIVENKSVNVCLDQIRV